MLLCVGEVQEEGDVCPALKAVRIVVEQICPLLGIRVFQRIFN